MRPVIPVVAVVLAGGAAVALGGTQQAQAPQATERADVVPAWKLRKAVAQRRAAERQVRRLRAEVRELRALTTLTPPSNRALGRRIAAKRYGWTGAQWRALDELWGSRESGWSARALNPTSGACHIPQALPCRKIPGGLNASPATAILWGLRYVHGRYGSPQAALAHSRARGWY